MLFAILLGCVCVLVVTLYLQYRWRHRRVLEAASKLPCPPTLPLIGNAHYLIGDFTKIMKRLLEWSNQYNGLYCVWVGPIPLIFVTNPADVKIILNNSGTLEKSFIYEYMKPIVGQGLITGCVSVWKRHRRLITRMFHLSNLERVIGYMDEVGRRIVKSIGQHSSTTIDPKNILFNNILYGNTESGAGSGHSILMDDDYFSNSQYLVDWFATSPMIRICNPAFYFETVFKLFYWNECKRASRCLSSLNFCIKQEMTKYKSSKYEDTSKHWISLMNIWDESTSERPDDPYWIDEFLTLNGAATGTTSTALYLLLMSLSANQDVQDKVYAEIKEVVGLDVRDLTLIDLNSLTYLGHAITESMRLHGVVPVIGRLATKDTELTKFTLPAGANVYIHLHAMGWDPIVFPEPHRFNPDRFLTADDQESRAMMNRILPFSAGTRNCIGKTYAMLLMKCILVHILSKYKLLTTVKLEDIDYELSFVILPKHPLLIEFSNRL